MYCTGVYKEAACRTLVPDTLLVQPVCVLKVCVSWDQVVQTSVYGMRMRCVCVGQAWGQGPCSLTQEDEGLPDGVLLGIFQMSPYWEGPSGWAGARAEGEARLKGKGVLLLSCCPRCNLWLLLSATWEEERTHLQALG